MINTSLVYAPAIHCAKSCNLKWVSPLSLVNKQSSVFLIILEKFSNFYSLLSPLISDIHILLWFMKWRQNWWWWNGDKEYGNQSFLSIIILPTYSTNTYWLPTVCQMLGRQQGEKIKINDSSCPLGIHILFGETNA